MSTGDICRVVVETVDTVVFVRESLQSTVELAVSETGDTGLPVSSWPTEAAVPSCSEESDALMVPLYPSTIVEFGDNCVVALIILLKNCFGGGILISASVRLMSRGSFETSKVISATGLSSGVLYSL